MELHFYRFVENFILPCQYLSLARQIVRTQRHFHEELLSYFTIALQIWMQVILVDARHLAARVSQHLPCIYDVILWNAAFVRYLFYCRLHVLTRLLRATLTDRDEIVLSHFLLAINLHRIIASGHWHHQENHGPSWQVLYVFYQVFVSIYELLLRKRLLARVHRAKSQEDKLWKRFHELLVSAVVEERSGLHVGQNGAAWHAIVHEGVLNGLIVITEQLVEQVWPPVLACDRAIGLIREACLQGQTLLFALRRRTASHCSRVTRDRDPYLAFRRRRNREEVLLAWKLGLLGGPGEALRITLTGQIDVKFAHHFAQFEIPWPGCRALGKAPGLTCLRKFCGDELLEL